MNTTLWIILCVYVIINCFLTGFCWTATFRNTESQKERLTAWSAIFMTLLFGAPVYLLVIIFHNSFPGKKSQESLKENWPGYQSMPSRYFPGVLLCKELHALLGNYKTMHVWDFDYNDPDYAVILDFNASLKTASWETPAIPAPTFGELTEMLYDIAEMKNIPSMLKIVDDNEVKNVDLLARYIIDKIQQAPRFKFKDYSYNPGTVLLRYNKAKNIESENTEGERF